MRPISDTESARGPLLRQLRSTPEIGEVQGLAVHLVDGSVPFAKRRSIARVAYVAQRSMPEFKTGYDGTVTDDDERLYVLCRNDRAIAIALTAFSSRFWQLEWVNGGHIRLRTREALLERRPAVGRVWVASDEQHQGFGLALVKQTLSHLSVEASAVGWAFPFTSGGEALVRRLCPGQFLVCCDPMELRDALSPCSEHAT